MKKLRLAVLISGAGTTLQNLINHAQKGLLQGEVVVVISSKPEAYGLKRAQRQQIPAICVNHKRFSSPNSFSCAIYQALAPFRPQLIVLAGFLHLLRVPKQWEGKIINIHPALLPAFGGKGMYGLHVHKAVLEAGAKITGATVHFVDEHYDTGPIIMQAPVFVRPDDTPQTLQNRVQEVERALLPFVINLLAAGKVRKKGRRVRLLLPHSTLIKEMASWFKAQQNYELRGVLVFPV
jgi:formyltetrahydrofolate-dependent phosphoribosylglycinamide formyltransferase